MALNTPVQSIDANGYSRAHRRRIMTNQLRPSMSLDFMRGQMDPRVQFSRASGGSFIGANGRLQTSRYNYQQRSDARTAVAGSPGTAPTGYSMVLGLSNGVTRSITNVGTIDGIAFMDVSFVGTFTAAETPAVSPPPGLTTVAASAGQSWTHTVEWGVLSGSLPAPTPINQNGARLRFGNPGLLQANGASDVPRSWNSGRQSVTAVAPAGTTVVGGDWLWGFGAGQAINCTIRFSFFQLELANSFVEYVPTYGVEGGAPRFDHDPSTIVEQNLVYNSTFAGIPVGMNGGFLNGWGINGAGGITPVVVGVGALSDGTPYVDIRFQGTAGAAGPYFPNFIGSPSNLLAEVTPLSTVTHAAMVSIVAGTPPASPVYVSCNGQNAGSFTESFSMVFRNVGAPQLIQASRTFTNAATNRVNMGIQMSLASNEVIDFTVRFARPQTVRGGVLLPYVPTTHLTGGVTRCAMRGLLLEEQRTNSLRNSEAGGAAAGTPGTLPTNWLEASLAAGLTRTVVRTGSEDGFNYVDIQVSGTTADAAGWQLQFEGNTQIAASVGQIWANSFYCSLVGGSTANVSSWNVRITEADGVGAYLTDSVTAFTPSGGPLSTRRFQHTRTLANAGVAFVRPILFMNIASGVAVDFTLRIAAPQAELCPAGAHATSYIPTTSTAVTRAPDQATVTGANFSSWYNQTEGTFAIEASQYHNTAAQSAMILHVDDNTGGNRLYATSSGGSRMWNVDTAAVTQAAIGTASAPTPGVAFKQSVAYRVDDIASCFNGGNVSLDSLATLPAVDRMRLGNSVSLSNASFLDGHIRRITYYSFRLPNAVLQGLSS